MYFQVKVHWIYYINNIKKFKLSSNMLCRALVDKAELELSSCRPMSAVNG